MTIKRHLVASLVGLLLLTCLRGHAAAAQEPAAIVAGTVSIAGPDGQPMVLPGVTITLACKNAESRTEVSDEQGEFRFADILMAAFDPSKLCFVERRIGGRCLVHDK